MPDEVSWTGSSAAAAGSGLRVLMGGLYGGGQNRHRPSPPSPHLAPVDPGGGRGVVLVLAPGRMVEVEHEIDVAGGHGVVEGELADRPPGRKGAALVGRRAVGFALVGHLDEEGEGALGGRVAAVEDLGQDLVTEVE